MAPQAEPTGELVEAIDLPALAAIPEVRSIYEQAAGVLRQAIATSSRSALERGSDEPILLSPAWRAFEEAIRTAWEGGPLDDLARSVIEGTAAETPLDGLEIDRVAINRTAAGWIRSHGFEDAQGLTASGREAARQLVAEAFNPRRPTTWRQAARSLIEANVFDLSPYEVEQFTGWVDRRLGDAANPRGEWYDLTAKQIQRRIDGEHSRRLKRRVRMLTRQSIYDAGNEARLITWSDSVAQGAISPEDYELEWLTRVINVCPRCQALAGITAPLVDPVFVSRPVEGGGKWDGKILRVRRPTVHPGCWCTLRTKRRRKT